MASVSRNETVRTRSYDRRHRVRWPDEPCVLAVAIYPDTTLAELDFEAVWGIHHEGELDHVAAAVLEKRYQPGQISS